MSNFLYIFTNIILPIFIMVGMGALMQKKFSLHIASFSKVQIYVLLPSMVFLNLYTSTLSKSLISTIVIYTVALFFILTFLGTGVARVLKMSRVREKSFINSITLRNTGNFGIPLVALIFVGTSGTYAMSVHMIAMATSSVLMYTFGLYNASSGKYTVKQALQSVFKIPTIYMMLLAGLFKLLHVQVPDTLLEPISYFSGAVVPMALFTLGAQLSQTKFEFGDTTVYLGNTVRLIISPIIAYFMGVLMHLDPVAAQVLVIGAATPTAVNSLLMAIEFDGDADYASQTIFLSTLLSAVTVSILIFIMNP